MKTTNLFVVVLMAVNLFAADPLTEKLQRGLFEEEANHNLDAAIKEYQSVVALSDEQRKVMATALFRLGECYRKLGRTNEANAQYQRILRDFSEQAPLVKLAGEFVKPSLAAAGSKSALVLELEKKIAALRVESISQQMAAERLASLSRDDLINTDVVQNDGLYLNLIRQGMPLAQKSAELKTKYGGDHPEMKALDEQRKKLIDQIDERIKAIVAGTQERAKLVAAQVQALGEELKKAEAGGGGDSGSGGGGTGESELVRELERRQARLQGELAEARSRFEVMSKMSREDLLRTSLTSDSVLADLQQQQT